MIFRQDAKPFRGPESFRSQDAHFFFGRDREARDLVSKILAHRFTMIYARSGAGKTSLLNARVLLDVERQGRMPVSVRIQEHPAEATIIRTLQEVLPPPAAELLAIERAIERIEPCDEDTTLSDLRDLYSEIPLRDAAHRQLVAPARVDPNQLSNRLLPVHGPLMPYFCRLLRGSMAVTVFSEHLRLYTGDPEASRTVTPCTRLGTLLDLLSHPGVAKRYDRIVGRLWMRPDLASFFIELFRAHHEADVRLSLVLLFDQFEVLFTRLEDEARDDGGPELRSQRKAFFQEFVKLYWRGRGVVPETAKGGRSGQHGAELPIRYVIAIRQDFMALLDDVRRIVPNLHERSYHLDFLTRDGAEEAVQEPGKVFNMEFTAECRDRLYEESLFEGSWIDPTYLQIICDHLWAKYWESPEAKGNEPGKIVIDENLLDLEVREGILTAFFRRFLKQELASDEERLEALEILKMLITGRNTRNSVLREDLIDDDYRNPELRSALLEKMEKGHIVRAEQRLGNLFIEITLERLIEPIKEVVAEKMDANPEYQEFARALQRLARASKSDFRKESRSLLEKSDIQALDRHRKRLQWGYLAYELMLRSSILEDLPVGSWIRALSGSSKVWEASDLLDDQHERVFALDELTAINQERDDLDDEEELSREHVERILRSSMAMEFDDDIGRQNLRFWTRKLEEQET